MMACICGGVGEVVAVVTVGGMALAMVRNLWRMWRCP